ncbi:hypothetical protein Lal_00046667 [Lupinus albus]|nr:hypothetical protein Lal_00046667 [Lupinus albus]
MPTFSVGPARTGTRTTWIRRGLFLTRSNFPHGHGKTHQHAWESLLGRWEGAPWHAILTHQGAWAGRQLPLYRRAFYNSRKLENQCGTCFWSSSLCRQPWLNNSKLASKFGAIFMKGSAPYHAFTEIGNAPRTHVPIVDLAPTNRTQPSFGFIHKHTQPWLNNSKLASKFGAIFMKGSAPYHAFTEIGNASEAKKTHTRHGTCPWATFAFT